MSNLGTLYVIAAPSGAGKTSLVNALLQTTPNLKVSVSHTTRPKRPAEHEGLDYFFITIPQFEDMVKDHVFLEYAEVHHHLYGTSRRWVEQQLAADIDVILEIDWQGARQVRQQFPQALSVFIMPPSQAALAARLESRKQDNLSVIQQRLEAASSEMSHYHEFDYLVVNDVFEKALEDLQKVIGANRLRCDRQLLRYEDLLAELVQN